MPADFDTIDKILDYNVRYDLKKKKENFFKLVNMFGVRLNETEIETDQHLLFLCKYSRNIVFVDILELEHFPELVSV